MDICTVMYSFKIDIEYICCAAHYSRCIFFDVLEFTIQWEKTGTQVPSAYEQYEKVLWKERRKRKYFHSENGSGKTPRRRRHWKVVGFCQTEGNLSQGPKMRKVHDCLWNGKQFLLFKYRVLVARNRGMKTKRWSDIYL